MSADECLNIFALYPKVKGDLLSQVAPAVQVLTQHAHEALIEPATVRFAEGAVFTPTNSDYFNMAMTSNSNSTYAPDAHFPGVLVQYFTPWVHDAWAISGNPQAFAGLDVVQVGYESTRSPDYVTYYDGGPTPHFYFNNDDEEKPRRHVTVTKDNQCWNMFGKAVPLVPASSQALRVLLAMSPSLANPMVHSIDLDTGCVTHAEEQIDRILQSAFKNGDIENFVRGLGDYWTNRPLEQELWVYVCNLSAAEGDATYLARVVAVAELMRQANSTPTLSGEWNFDCVTRGEMLTESVFMPQFNRIFDLVRPALASGVSHHVLQSMLAKFENVSDAVNVSRDLQVTPAK